MRPGSTSTTVPRCDFVPIDNQAMTNTTDMALKMMLLAIADCRFRYIRKNNTINTKPGQCW